AISMAQRSLAELTERVSCSSLRPTRTERGRSVLHNFTGADGANSYAGLISDPAGNFYGTATYGAAYGGGTAFELARNPDGTWTYNVLQSFTGGNGPNWPVIFGKAGNLYGTTLFGGAYGDGTVFKLTPNPDGT